MVSETPRDSDSDSPDTGEGATPDSLARKFQKELNSGLIGLVLLSVLDRDRKSTRLNSSHRH